MSKNKINLKELVTTALKKRIAVSFSSLIELIFKRVLDMKPELASGSPLEQSELRDKVVSCIESMEKSGEITSYDVFEGEAYVDSVYLLPAYRLDLPVAPVSIDPPAAEQCGHMHRGQPEMYAYVWRDTKDNSLIATVSEAPTPVAKLFVDTPPNVESGLFAMYPIDVRIQIKEANYGFASSDRQQEVPQCQHQQTTNAAPTTQATAPTVSSESQ